MYFGRVILTYLTFNLLLFGCKKDDEESNLIRIYPPVPERTTLIPAISWKLSSTPPRFPESFAENKLAYGYNRAKICWYNVDPIFQTITPLLPPHLSKQDMSYDYTRQVLETEIYPNHDIPSGTPNVITTFNIDFYPSDIGPYNFDLEPTEISSGIDENAKLVDPETRWGGITRVLSYINHEVNYITFYLMDPFLEDDMISGELFINIGSFSEEVLYDKFHQNESSIEPSPVNNDTSSWGIYGTIDPWAIQFSNVDYQDFGLDGLNDNQEKEFYSSYLSAADQICTPEAYELLSRDPSKDNYHYYRGTDYDESAASIADRYYYYNSLEGNSTPDFPFTESYPTRSTTLPDKEDIDNDASINTNNCYYEYQIKLDRHYFFKGMNNIDFIQYAQMIPTIDGSMHAVHWYHFSIPIQNVTSSVGTTQTLSEFKMIRIYLTGFEDPVRLRFAEFYLTE